jgi:hypothetical protein
MWDDAKNIPDDGTDRPGYHSSQMLARFWSHDRAPRLEVEDTWFGFRYGGLRTTPNGHTHARVTSYCLPFSVFVASNPIGVSQQVHVPIDDHNTWLYFISATPELPERFAGRPGLFDIMPFRLFPNISPTGIIERDLTADNDYGIDRDTQRGATFSGISDFFAQDYMATESMGPIVDRTRQHLGTSDRAILRMYHQLLGAAKAVGEGGSPPALAGEGRDFRSIRSAEKVLDEGEDWRVLGSDDDPIVREMTGASVLGDGRGDEAAA